MFLRIDESIFFFFNHTIANPVCDAVIGFFMKIPGQYAIVFIAALILVIAKKYHKFSSLILLSSYVIAKYTYGAIKLFVHRPRPFVTLDNVRLLLGQRDGFSFPSGHSTISFCLATVIAMRYPKARYPVFIAALLVAFSRPYLGLHYPSDILAGAILGISIGYLVTRASKNLET